MNNDNVDEQPVVPEQVPEQATEQVPEQVPEVAPEVAQEPAQTQAPEQPLHVDAPEPMDPDFPVKYEVRSKIVDRNNPASPIEYIVHLYGVNGEDFGESTYTQDLTGLDDDSVVTRGEQLAQEAASNFYENPLYAKLVKIAPKRPDAHETESVDFTPLQDGLSSLTTDLSAFQEGLTTHAETIEQGYAAQNARFDQLEQQLSTLTTSFVSVEAQLREMNTWLTQLYGVLAS